MNDKQVMNRESIQETQVAKARPIIWSTPAVDIYETDDALVLQADVPGVEEQGLQLEIARGLLTLEAEVQAAEKDRPHGYYRQFQLSERINADAGNAELKDGVLTLRLPKSEAAKPKRIAVKSLH